MRATHAVGAVAVIVVAAACMRAEPRAPAEPARAEAPEAAVERAVWTALLDSVFVAELRMREIAIAERTTNLTNTFTSYAWWSRRGAFPVDSPTVADFLRRNAQPRPFPGDLPIAAHITVLDAATRQAAKRAEPDEATEALQPERYYIGVGSVTGASGVIQVSRPGFSQDGATAFVMLDYGCGSLCGWSDGFLLGHGADGRWRIRARHRFAVS